MAGPSGGAATGAGLAANEVDIDSGCWNIPIPAPAAHRPGGIRALGAHRQIQPAS
ncbi:MAG: hypothetical protein ACRD25_01115 [Terracidiphilus sp.]